MAYQREISRQNKACFLFLLDQSYSMEEPLGNSNRRKCDELVTAVNGWLHNMAIRAAGDEAYARHLASLVGTTQRILIEREGLGRTEGFTLVGLDGGEPGTPGTIVERVIAGHDDDKLIASRSGQQAA